MRRNVLNKEDKRTGVNLVNRGVRGGRGVFINHSSANFLCELRGRLNLETSVGRARWCVRTRVWREATTPQGDREGRSRGPFGDATPKRDAGAPHCARRHLLRCPIPAMRGPSDNAPERHACKEERKRACAGSAFGRVSAQRQSQARVRACQRVRSVLTQRVIVNEGRKLNTRAAFPGETSGQLRFLG
jgi:hypothetical protein